MADTVPTNGDTVVTVDDFVVESTFDEAKALAALPAESVDTPADEPIETAPKPNGQPAKKRNDPESRIADATAKEAAAKRERDELKARADRLESELSALRAPRQPVNGTKATDDPEPKLDDFKASEDPYTDWIRAQARWEARKEFRESESKRQQTEAQRHYEDTQRARVKTFNERLASELKAPLTLDALKAAGVSDDVLGLQTAAQAFDAARAANQGPPNLDTGNAVADYLADCDTPLALMRHLSDNPAELQALLSLHPVHAIGRMGRLEERVGAVAKHAAGPIAPTVTSAAKPPIKPVGGSPVVSDDAPGEDSDLDSHIKWHNARDHRINPRAARH